MSIGIKTYKQLKLVAPLLFKSRKELTPLKVGILKDIVDVMHSLNPTMSKVTLRKRYKRLLKIYTTSYAYQVAIINNTHRFNMLGLPVQEISQEHKDFAIQLKQKYDNMTKGVKLKKASAKFNKIMNSLEFKRAKELWSNNATYFQLYAFLWKEVDGRLRLDSSGLKTFATEEESMEYLESVKDQYDKIDYNLYEMKTLAHLKSFKGKDL